MNNEDIRATHIFLKLDLRLTIAPAIHDGAAERRFEFAHNVVRQFAVAVTREDLQPSVHLAPFLRPTLILGRLTIHAQPRVSACELPGHPVVPSTQQSLPHWDRRRREALRRKRARQSPCMPLSAAEYEIPACTFRASGAPVHPRCVAGAGCAECSTNARSVTGRTLSARHPCSEESPLAVRILTAESPQRAGGSTDAVPCAELKVVHH